MGTNRSSSVYMYEHGYKSRLHCWVVLCLDVDSAGWLLYQWQMAEHHAGHVVRGLHAVFQLF